MIVAHPSAIYHTAGAFMPARALDHQLASNSYDIGYLLDSSASQNRCFHCSYLRQIWWQSFVHRVGLRQRDGPAAATSYDRRSSLLCSSLSSISRLESAGRAPLTSTLPIASLSPCCTPTIALNGRYTRLSSRNPPL